MHYAHVPLQPFLFICTDRLLSRSPKNRVYHQVPIKTCSFITIAVVPTGCTTNNLPINIKSRSYTDLHIIPNRNQAENGIPGALSCNYFLFPGCKQKEKSVAGNDIACWPKSTLRRDRAINTRVHRFLSSQVILHC